MTSAIVQAAPAELERFSAASVASLVPAHDAVGHYRRALLAFQAARNDLRAPTVVDLSAAIAGELDRLATVDAVPARIATALVGADAARLGLRDDGPAPPLARAGTIAPVRSALPVPDGSLLPRPDDLQRLWDLLTRMPRRLLVAHVLGTFVLPHDVLASSGRGRDALGDRRTWLGRYAQVAGRLAPVLGLLALPETWHTLRYGSEHDGWRGIGDRVAAGASIIALIGGGVALIGAATAAVAGVGAAIAGVGAGVAVGAGVVAGGWVVGSLLWDRRRDIARDRLGRVHRRGEEVQLLGRGVRTAGDVLARTSALAGAGTQTVGRAVAESFDALADDLAASRDDLAELQASLEDRAEGVVEGVAEVFAEDRGPIADVAVDHATDLLDRGTERVDGALHASQLAATGLAAGSRQLGDAAGRGTRRVGTAAGDAAERAGGTLVAAGTSVRAGVRTVGSWLGLDQPDPGDVPVPAWETTTCHDVGRSRAVDDPPPTPPPATPVDQAGAR